MNYQIYLRPLHLEDAKISYQWRNQPDIWVYTKHTSDKEITVESETAWLSDVLHRRNERRFAICLKKNDQYVGNAQLLNITKHEACFHLFIGEKELWGKGIGKAATCALMKFAFRKIGLKKVILQVNKDNSSGIAVYEKIGFVPVGEEDNFIEMELTPTQFEAALDAHKMLHC